MGEDNFIPMTAEEYRSALDGLGLSQVDGGALLSVDPRTSRRWASGTHAVPPDKAMVLRLLIHKRIAWKQFERLGNLPLPGFEGAARARA